ncbi:MAG: tRNA uridine-5-carboxymethylaminomethyl(34) synthesis GTPase MnmE [Bacteroidales bacterium]|nr:tRNA uridine-5-carboxymethylaminomethyl(34) synthesis GTPase MnmE [Bacteroidales bacterium]
MANYSDTICAPATPVGGGAVSVIRISGQEALAVTDRVVSFRRGDASSAPGYSLKYGTVPGLDDVLVSIFRAPHSYTGEDAAEISCHASPFIVSSLLDRLTEAGCRLADPGEFTQRAFLNGKMDLAQAEAVADIISSTTSAQHRVAMNQLRGGYSQELRGLRRQLLELTALMELELDFSEEDVEFADRTRLRELLDTACSHCRQLADSFRLGNAIRNGVPVAIVGAPNSGKSTLLNALLRDDRAIVSEIPGTTRDTVEETYVLDGVLFRFIDTAGIRASSDEIERLGIERTYRKISEADIVLGVIDGTKADSEATIGSAVQDIAARIDFDRQKLLILLNKTDILGVNNLVKNVNFFVLLPDYQGEEISVLAISAKTGSGLENLRSKLVSAVGPTAFESTLVTNARHAQALRSAAESLSVVSDGLDQNIPSDLLAEDLRAALASLGSITGEITTDEVLGEIFSRFCIGK